MVNSGHGIRAVALLMLMTQPRLLSTIPGMTIRHMLTTDVMLHRTISSKSFGPHPAATASLSSRSSAAFRKYSGCGYDSPTLLTNTPTSRPCSSPLRFPYTAAVSGSVKSALTHLTRLPGYWARISSAVASSLAWVRLTSTTSMPWLASCRAYSLPSPSVAPVTTYHINTTYTVISLPLTCNLCLLLYIMMNISMNDRWEDIDDRCREAKNLYNRWEVYYKLTNPNAQM